MIWLLPYHCFSEGDIHCKHSFSKNYNVFNSQMDISFMFTLLSIKLCLVSSLFSLFVISAHKHLSLSPPKSFCHDLRVKEAQTRLRSREATEVWNYVPLRAQQYFVTNILKRIASIIELSVCPAILYINGGKKRWNHAFSKRISTMGFELG